MAYRAFSVDWWSIVPGAESVRPPLNSLSQDEVARYSPTVVANEVLALRSVKLVTPNEPDWWSWRARWLSEARFIDLSMTLFEPETGEHPWGGFGLSGTGTPGDLVALYTGLHAALPRAWLHNGDCEFHDAESFLHLYGAET